MNSLINVSEGYIQNLGSLGPLLHVKKFVVVVGGGGGGGWYEVTTRDKVSKIEIQITIWRAAEH